MNECSESFQSSALYDVFRRKKKVKNSTFYLVIIPLHGLGRRTVSILFRNETVARDNITRL